MDYNTANTKLGSRDSRKLENNTYLQRRGESAIAVKLHATDERGDKRAVKKFVAAYMEAMERGEVPAPGPGDCFYCGMREVGTLRPLGEVHGGDGHIRSHFEEPYFVPALLSRALEVFGASPVARNWVAAYWDTSAPEDTREAYKTGYFAKYGREQCAKMLRRYVLRQLGYHA